MSNQVSPLPPAPRETQFHSGSTPASPLQACPVCEALIDISDHEPLAEIECPGCGASQTVRGWIAHFELLEVAGRGGMGVVYKAHDTSLNRQVALKLLRKDHSGNAALIAQLETEAAITASINHPHVVKVFSTGADCGRFYIVMELVSKGSLDDLMRLQGRVAEAQALEVGVQIAQGLRAAQQHGLIHRDVKPGNILFSAARTAKIVDFGLAVFLDDEESVRGEVWGTPYYVAPEKLDSKPEDFRSDIYSLGGTLFHALAGRPPFEAKNASLVALKHLKSQPVSLQAFAPHVSSSTAYVINRTLHKDPEQRYQSYDELIEHLEYARTELLSSANKPVQKRVVLEGEDQQRALGWITAAMILLILAVIGGFFAMQSGGGNSAPARNSAGAPMEKRAAARSVFDEPRALLIDGSFSEAAAAFRALSSNSKLTGIEKAWAALQEGLADLSAGNTAAAARIFSQLPERSTPLSAEQPEFAAFLAEMAVRLTQNSRIAPAAAAKLNRRNYESIAILLYALHNWQLGHVEEGAALFRQFRSAVPSGSDAWIGKLKPLATSSIEEFTRFTMAAEQLKSAPSIDARLRAADALQTFKGPFAARAAQLLKPYAGEFAEFERKAAMAPADGLYKLVNRNSGKTMDVQAHSKSDRGNVTQWEYVGGDNQQWHLTSVGGGLYTLIAEHSGKALHLENSSKDDGANVQQFQPNGSDAQKWRIISAGRGWFKLISAASGKVLAVEGGATDNGASLVQWSATNGEDQQWMFVGTRGAAGDWYFRDIGDVTQRGGLSIDEASGRHTIKAAGRDIWDKSDSFHFAYEKLTGSFELIVQITKLEATHPWAKAGLMVRDSLKPGARNGFVGISAENGATLQGRLEPDVESLSAKAPGPAAPHWLKLVRNGKTISGFHSSDGAQWTAIGEHELNLPETVYAGLAATSHNPDLLTTAEFEQVEVRRER